MRFTSLVRLTGSTGWKFQLLFQWPFSNLKLLNWFVIDHKLLTGLVSFRFNSLADSSCPSGSAAVAPGVAGTPEVCCAIAGLEMSTATTRAESTHATVFMDRSSLRNRQVPNCLAGSMRTHHPP